MDLKVRLGRNVADAVRRVARARDIEISKIWIVLAREGWPDEVAGERSRVLKQFASGERWPTPETWAKLAAVLRVEPWELLAPTGE